MARIGYRVGQRRWLVILLVVLIGVGVIFTALSRAYIDLLWYREVHLSSVFFTVLRTKLVLGVLFGLVFFAVLFASLTIARRLAPVTRMLTPDQEVVERFRQGVEPYLWWLLPLFCLVLAFFTAVGASHEWQTFLLWRHSAGVTFGSPDPLFHRDPSFYVFDLPWWRFVQGWLFSSLVAVTFLSAIAHVLWGGIRPQAPQLGDKVTPLVRAHLSVLLAMILLTKAWGYWLGRFNLLTSPRGVVEGASYTDVHAQLPALRFLMVAAVICAGLFIANIRVRQWLLPGIAVVLLGVVSVLFGAAYPAYVQTFSVKPQEQQRESPFIARNIGATRRAFGLDKITLTQSAPTPTVPASDVNANPLTISNLRLWRPSILQENFQSLQRFRPFYDFNDVDVDRYPIAGQESVLMVSGREVTQNGIPGTPTWQTRHLIYTHGFGAVASQVNTAGSQGQPDLILQNIPPVGTPTVTQPRIYYGELHDVPFVVVDTATQELDYEGATSPQPYGGLGGIRIGNIFQRALFAWRYHDINLLISGQINSNSRILINRDLADRVIPPAPFLSFDHDPYMAVVDGRLVWIWDAYTTTSAYPYSQAINLAQATGNPALPGAANYIRNSVKVTVDAYDGTLHYYVADPTDPIIRVWERAFPDLFTPFSQASTDLQAHFRYPENLFQVQAVQYARYHVTSPTVFFQNQDVWQIPDDPTFQANTRQQTQTAALAPNYLLLRLPEQTSAAPRFYLTMPFVPQGRQNMVGWMAASSDPGSYGQIVAFEFPQGENVLGPSQVFSEINQDPTFSSERSLLSQQGSSLLFGDLLVIPIGDSYLYVEPVYVRSQQGNAIPQLKRVLVVNGGNVGLGDNLQQALSAATGAAAATGGNQLPAGKTVQSLLAAALQHFKAADAALKAGNLGLYQSELQKAQQLVQQANLLASKPGGGVSVSPGPVVSPTPTPTSPTPTSPTSPTSPSP